MNEEVRSVIEVPAGKPLMEENSKMVIEPATQIPSFNFHYAKQRGVEFNILVKVDGGIGDRICAEPAIRYGFKKYRCAISIESTEPEMFRHLPFNQVFDPSKVAPDYSKFWVMKSYRHPSELHGEFVSHGSTQSVDNASLCLWKSQMPLEDRCIQLHPDAIDRRLVASLIDPRRDVVVHAGSTWQSRTYPVEWWQKVLNGIRLQGLRPVLIGKHFNGEQAAINRRGVVNLDRKGCLDLVDRLSLMQTVAVTQLARCVLTNDSAPLHMAASGKAHIGFLSTARAAFCVTHYRNGGEFGWRMKCFSKGSASELIDTSPQVEGLIDIANIDPRQFLPDPRELVDFAAEVMCRS